MAREPKIGQISPAVRTPVKTLEGLRAGRKSEYLPAFSGELVTTYSFLQIHVILA